VGRACQPFPPEEFRDQLNTRAIVVPARLRNNAGIVGAAMAAATEELT